MATKKKGSGVNKIAKMILGGKTAAPKKNLRSKMSDKISFIKAFEGQTDFSFRASNIAAQINLDTRWSQLGRDMSANLNNYNDEYTDVTNDETFEQTQENFETIQKQIEVISQFMIRVDYKFIDLQRKIKQSIVKTSGEITTNQEKLTVKVNDQLSSVHENVAAITNKLETHDRQLDELYSEIKSKSKISKVKDFLSGKKDKEQKQSAFIKNKEIEETKHHKVGITDLINVETVIEGGLLYKGMKSLYGLGKKGFKGAGRLAGKGAIAAGGIGKNLSKSAFMRLLVIIEKHLGAVAAKRLATAVGGSWIGPGVMVLVLGISLYDAYQIWQEFMEEENALNGVKPKTPLSPRGKFGPGFNLGQGNGPLGAPKQLSVPQGKFGPNWSPGITKPGVTPDAAIKNFQNNRNIQQNNDTARTYSPKGEVRSTQSPSQEIKTNQPNVEIKATAPKPESVLTNLNLKGISAADAPDFSNKGEDRYNTAIPASIRHNNPGATYPAKWMENYGMNGVDIIGGGHKIANFPDAISGTAANFNLFYNKYTGKDLQSAITMWSGGNSVDTYLKVINRETGPKPINFIT
jgi:antitoxin component HigA of HigAB toxin-antitoxin module